MLEQSHKDYFSQTTPENIAHRQAEFDAYMNRQYKGKPWRRLSEEEIVALEDAELLAQLESLSKIVSDPNPTTEPILTVREDGAIMHSSDPDEVTGDQEYVLGGALVGGDITGPNGNALWTEEDFARFDETIANERDRIYRLVTSPPRTGKYLEIFKKKFPNRTEKELSEGFVLSENGVESEDFTAWKDRQETSHKRSGSGLLDGVEIARREAIAPEDKETVVAYADANATKKLQEYIIGKTTGTKHTKALTKVQDGHRKSIINRYMFEVEEGDGFVPEEDLVDPEIYLLNQDTVEMPIADMIRSQRESLNGGDLVRGIPPKVASNG